MKGSNIFKFFCIFSLILVTFSLLSCQQGITSQDEVKTARAGSSVMAPDFTLPDIDGKPFSMSSTKGKVVILDFWSIGCTPCKDEIPHFVELYNEYKDQGLEIIGMCLDVGAERYIKSFLQSKGAEYPVVFADRKVVSSYGGVQYIPTTFIIDREGRITEKFVGYRSKEFFESRIKELL